MVQLKANFPLYILNIYICTYIQQVEKGEGTLDKKKKLQIDERGKRIKLERGSLCPFFLDLSPERSAVFTCRIVLPLKIVAFMTITFSVTFKTIFIYRIKKTYIKTVFISACIL